MSTAQRPNLSLASNLKIALFHLGSGMADVLTTGVWNRIMVADLGFSAAIVGLLTGLRYFLAPIGVWAGRFSDRRAVGGYRRLFWIWLGRAMMTLSAVTLGFATAELVERANLGAGAGSTPPALWLALVLSFLLFSLGNALSGSVFLALIYDRAAERQRGRAVGIVWTFLLIGFAASGIFFSLLLPSEDGAGELGFSADSLLTLFLVTAVALCGLWFFSLLGEERRASTVAAAPPAGGSLRRDLSLVWRSRDMRFFLLYLTLSMLFTFLQDTVLEPFAGQVFGMEAHVTNRFAAYWGGMAILGSFVVLALSRRFPQFSSGNLSRGGVFVLVLAYAAFALSALGETRGLVTPGLALLGLGMGVWNIGTLGLMMEMSPAGKAGAFLGFWTLCVTFARGAGVAGGGIMRDIMLAITGDHAMAYGAVFCFGLLGLLLAFAALMQMKVARAAAVSDATMGAALSGALD